MISFAMVGVLSFFLSHLSFGQVFTSQATAEPFFDMPNGYYVVIAAFDNHYNSRRFLRKIQEEGESASYGRHYAKGHFYIYKHYSEDKETAFAKRAEVVSQGKFTDAWVFRVNNNYTDNQGRAGSETEKPSVQVSLPEKPMVKDERFKDEEKVYIKEPSPIIQSDVASAQVAKVTSVEEKTPPPSPEGSFTLKVRVETINAQSGNKVETELEVIDVTNSKFLKKIKANQLEFVNFPLRNQSKLNFVASPFGYKKFQDDISFQGAKAMLDEGKARMEGDVLVVPMELQRYSKGETMIMYNVFFHKDASVMQPVSKYELDQLLELMQENEKVKITIHGHTNSNLRGKILSLPKDNNDFFNVGPYLKESSGSAKQLSLERAEMIMRYLVDKGIDPKRMKVKGWGGKKMLFDANGPDARKNLRVEIELMDS